MQDNTESCNLTHFHIDGLFEALREKLETGNHLDSLIHVNQAHIIYLTRGTYTLTSPILWGDEYDD